MNTEDSEKAHKSVYKVRASTDSLRALYKTERLWFVTGSCLKQDVVTGSGLSQEVVCNRKCLVTGNCFNSKWLVTGSGS